MRIAYVVGRYPSVSHQFILREVAALRRLGVEVLPVSIHRPGAEHLLSEADRAEAQRTVSVLPTGAARVLRAHLRAVLTRPRRYAAMLRAGQRLARPGLRGRVYALFYAAEAGILWAELRRLGVEHVHVHHLNQAADATIMALELQGPPGAPARWSWSYTMHGPDELSDVTMFRLREKALAADAVACISDFARSQVMAVLPVGHWDKLRVVRCGLAAGEFAHVARAGRDAGAPLRVLFVGRMTPVKGQLVLLDALAALRGRGVAFEAVLIGDGPVRATLAERAAQLGLADAVRLPGAVGQDDIRGHYAWADVFCLPSFAEGVPVVLMEAMATGLPVVTTRVAGIPELVEDGVSGFVLPPGRADAVADALAALAADPERREAMGRAGAAVVAGRFDADREAARLRDLFASAAGGRRG